MSTSSAKVVDVARAAGVAVGTVSNVLAGKSTVTPQNRERVLRAIEALGFVPNDVARHLRVGRSHTIAVLVQNVRNPFFADLAVGVDDAAAAEGAYAMICSTNQSTERETDFLRALERSRPLGIVLAPVHAHTELIEQVCGLAHRGIPIAMIGTRLEGDDFCALHTDDVEGGRLAAHHLRDRGHSRVTYVSGPLSITACQRRLDGFLEGCRGTVDVTVHEAADLTIEAGAQAAAQVLQPPVRPTGVFCANDLLALGVLRTTLSLRLRVPEDLAIIGYDDIEYAGGAAVPLTSVRQPQYQMGMEAAELILDEVNGGHHHTSRTYAPQLIVRDSS